MRRIVVKDARAAVHQLFKPGRKGDRLTASYLYEDGHAVVAFERRDAELDQRVTYFKQASTVGLSCRFKGRIVFHAYGGTAMLRAMLRAGAHAVTAQPLSVESGSERTKRSGLPIGNVTFEIKGIGMADVMLMGWCSGGISYDADQVTFGDAFDPTRELMGDDHRQPILQTIVVFGERAGASASAEVAS